VLAQTSEDFEVIVSDNASVIPLRDALARFDDPRIRWIRRETLLPVTDHWEILLRESTGDFILLLADDDGLVPSTLAHVERLAQQTGAQCIHVGHWRYTHPLGHGPGENCLFPKAFSGCVEHIDGRLMVLSLLSVWGIKVDEPAALTLPVLHSSGLFMGRQAIEALYKRGVPLCARPFADVGFLGVVLEAGEMVSLDLPLAIIGLDVTSHLTHPIPGGRRHYDQHEGDMHWAPLRAISFNNLGVASHLDMWRHWTSLRVNEPQRLSSTFYMNHAAELFDDKIRDCRIWQDLLELFNVLSRLPGREGVLIGLTSAHRGFSPSWLRRFVSRLLHPNATPITPRFSPSWFHRQVSRHLHQNATPITPPAEVVIARPAAEPKPLDGVSLGFTDLVGAAQYMDVGPPSFAVGSVLEEVP
jgi:hypothetical protein